jgi:GTPase
MSENHIRVAVVGNVDAGKSTFIGSQVSSSLDDGRGSARVLVMKHKHERVTGRTSTIGTHLFGMDENAKPITGSSEGELARKASRLVTFMDLAGHEKYLKTTIAGVARGMADYAMVLVNSLQPPTHMTLQHLKLCVSIGIPVVVVMTKVRRQSRMSHNAVGLHLFDLPFSCRSTAAPATSFRQPSRKSSQCFAVQKSVSSHSWSDPRKILIPSKTRFPICC